MTEVCFVTDAFSSKSFACAKQYKIALLPPHYTFYSNRSFRQSVYFREKHFSSGLSPLHFCLLRLLHLQFRALEDLALLEQRVDLVLGVRPGIWNGKKSVGKIISEV